MTLFTHYDNLKVARNAPQEVIRAAFKTLSQKYHPDRNSGDPESARIMALINASYEVLSNPDRRREHDQWIVRKEAVNSIKRESKQWSHTTKHDSSNRTQNKVPPTLFQKIFAIVSVRFKWLFSNAIVIFFLIGIAWFVYSKADNIGGKYLPSPSLKPYQTSPKLIRSEYIRPISAPNNKPWPAIAGYVEGYPILHADGLSTITVDNSQNNSDVFVKLVSIADAEAYPVRQFYIPAFSDLTLNKITAGTYDIRYRDLSNGSLSRSESFALEEIKESNGIQYSNITLTLYKVQNGNMQLQPISETEF